MFVDLATKYEPKLLPMLKRGNDEEIILESVAEASALEAFSQRIVSLVGDDYPDYEGRDLDINEDAIKVVHLTSNLISKFKEAHPN